ncbi:hypothetical protein AALO_G00080290 [Alosa alosa]|uniref:LRRNT domain-containing protein n=1 Tax=Alosa alosa TaxID=278164 RepID=A0AAV6GX26_9TELE|nr:hypothetical protein AALO_G00080290 [Alosa alosa]
MRITTVTGLSSPSPLLLLAQLLLWLLPFRTDTVGAASTNCPTPCQCSNQASRVICTRRNLADVPDSISVNTRYLNLQENSIKVIKSETFKNLRHLEILQLSKNQISQIEVGAFNGLPNLNTLELFDNKLTQVPSAAFEYLSKLRELWLRNNPIETLPAYVFNRVPSLRRLDLGELKKLEHISEAAFVGLDNLRYLNLGMCGLKDIPNLTPLGRLEELELSGNRLEIVRPGSFQGLVSLRKLWLMHFRQMSVSWLPRRPEEPGGAQPVAQLASLPAARPVHAAAQAGARAPQPQPVGVQLRCAMAQLVAQGDGAQQHHLLCPLPRSAWPAGALHWRAGPEPLHVLRAGHRGAADRPERDGGHGGRAQVPHQHVHDVGQLVHAQRCALMAARLPESRISGAPAAAAQLHQRGLRRPPGPCDRVVSNTAGNTTATAMLNVTAAPSDNYTYFTTVTVETVDSNEEDLVNSSGSPALRTHNQTIIRIPGPTPSWSLVPTTASSLSWSASSTRGAFTVPVTMDPTYSSLEDVMKTTKIIIGCFVAITFMAAVMLVVFYKLRKQHQLHKHHGPARAIEIINVEDELGASAGVRGSGISGGSTMTQGSGGGSGTCGGGGGGGGGGSCGGGSGLGIGGSQSLRLHHPEIVNLPNLARAEHLNHYYKAHHFNNNMLGLGSMGTGVGLNNNNNPSPCSQGMATSVPSSGAISCSPMPVSVGSGTGTLGSLPTPVPLPQLSIHGSLKGLMGKGQNSQIEPLLFKSGSKENVQETQI